MTDQELADNIRKKAHELFDAVHLARQDGLTVHPPLMVYQWLLTGHPPGEPESWIITRHSL